MKFIFIFVLIVFVLSSPKCSNDEVAIAFSSTTNGDSCDTLSDGPMNTDNFWASIPYEECVENMICISNCTAMLGCQDAGTLNDFNACVRSNYPSVYCPAAGSWFTLHSFNGTVINATIYADDQCLTGASPIVQSAFCFDLGYDYCDMWDNYGWSQLYTCQSSGPEPSAANTLLPFDIDLSNLIVTTEEEAED